MMFGYATNETDNYMPLALDLAHAILLELAALRRENKQIKYLRPDAKSQVTLEYDDNNKPIRIDAIVVSTQHDPVVRGEEDNKKVQEIIAKDIQKYVLDEIISKSPIKTDANTTYFFNPSGRFVVGGPQGDAGLTGRKIIVDTYGGYARHGGGAFSGKDPTKVDRSAAYAARHAAKNIVAAGIADQCEIQISYAIGVANPTSIYVNTFGTSEYSDEVIIGLVQKVFDFRPQKIIENFNLQNLPKERGGRFYQDVAKYGHFGRKDLDLPWEKLDKVEELKKVLAQDFNLSLSK